tara:strand:- start:4845 stop:5822 length:978 start_codon:yes stop_codon:yes gene_type:complete
MGKVLVTGATGFIGSHLTELLVRKGYDVIAYDRYNLNNNYGWLDSSETIKNNIDFILGDIRDYDSVSKAMNGCESVFHLAALIGIPYSYVSPQAYIKTNIEGTYNILESAKNFDLDNILITSTSETYGTAQYTPMDENHPHVGQSPYSATKIAADQLSISYNKSFDLPIKIIRPFNTYGPRQSSRAIIPSIISQILNGSTTINLGSTHPTRDLTFVSDTIDGFYKIFNENSFIGESVNIGMNNEISIGDLVKKISRIMGTNVKIKVDKNRYRPKNSEVDRLICDNSKLVSNTNWKPKYDLNKGLKETVKWLSDNLSYFTNMGYNI